jgi:hypothetical protein
MILRRVIAHVKGRNWFALDFAIAVALNTTRSAAHPG